MARLAAAAGEVVGLDAEWVERLRRAGLVHDLGRVSVSNGIWDKRGRLTHAEWERARLHPHFSERVLRSTPLLAPLGRLAVRERGGDEPVVLLHPGFVADGMAPLFAEPALGAYRLVAYQRRGYGRSDRAAGPVTVGDQAEDLLGVLAARGIERAHLVGHSFGANVALELALTAPERVATLALLEPLLAFAVAPATAQFVLDTAAESYRRLGEGDPVGAVDGWLEAAFDPGYRDLLDGALPGAFEQAVADADAPFAVEVPSLQSWPRGPDDVRRVAQPALAVLGADGTWPGFRETQEALCSWLPRGERLLVPQATHLLQIANPRAVAEGLASFLARHPLRGAV